MSTSPLSSFDIYLFLSLSNSVYMSFFLPLLSTSVYLCLPLYICPFSHKLVCLYPSFRLYVPAFVIFHISSSRWLHFCLLVSPSAPATFLYFCRLTSLSLNFVIDYICDYLYVFCLASSVFCLFIFVALLLCLFIL